MDGGADGGAVQGVGVVEVVFEVEFVEGEGREEGAPVGGGVWGVE